MKFSRKNLVAARAKRSTNNTSWLKTAGVTMLLLLRSVAGGTSAAGATGSSVAANGQQNNNDVLAEIDFHGSNINRIQHAEELAAYFGKQALKEIADFEYKSSEKYNYFQSEIEDAKYVEKAPNHGRKLKEHISDAKEIALAPGKS